MVKLIPLDSLPDTNQEILVQILNGDTVLNEWLGAPPGQMISLAEFKQTNTDWQRTQNALVYCIWKERPVGTISLSHRKLDGTARIGYWLASNEWGKGIASEAFQQMLDIARQQGIHQVSATIERRNIASLRIWRRHRAVETLLDETHIQVTLKWPA